MRISELAELAGVPTSTVRFYERIGLLGAPARTAAGYRDYGEADAARLVFVSRARRMGLGCDQVADLLPVWDGTNCAAAHERVVQLIDGKQADIAERIAEMAAFSAQLGVVRATLEEAPPPPACRTDLSCCMPDGGDAPGSLRLIAKDAARRASPGG